MLLTEIRIVSLFFSSCAAETATAPAPTEEPPKEAPADEKPKEEEAPAKDEETPGTPVKEDAKPTEEKKSFVAMLCGCFLKTPTTAEETTDEKEAEPTKDEAVEPEADKKEEETPEADKKEETPVQVAES